MHWTMELGQLQSHYVIQMFQLHDLKELLPLFTETQQCEAWLDLEISKLSS